MVLPGLDLDLDAAGWDGIDTGEGFSRVIAHGHPQAVLHRLLGPENFNIGRAEVVALGEPDAGQAARAALLSQALRPADTTDAWAALDPAERDTVARLGLDGLALAEAADEREEALVAALALRETLQTPAPPRPSSRPTAGSLAGSPSNCCAGASWRRIPPDCPSPEAPPGGSPGSRRNSPPTSRAIRPTRFPPG